MYLIPFASVDKFSDGIPFERLAEFEFFGSTSSEGLIMCADRSSFLSQVTGWLRKLWLHCTVTTSHFEVAIP